MEIKKDKAGLVFVRGAVVKDAPTEEALNSLFEDGSKNRHVASTSKQQFPFPFPHNKISFLLNIIYHRNMDDLHIDISTDNVLAHDNLSDNNVGNLGLLVLSISPPIIFSEKAIEFLKTS